MQSNGRRFACQCLNVRIREQVASTPLPLDWPDDNEFTYVYAGESGITVIHPQLTLRSRMRGSTTADGTRCTRYTSLTCLICQALVYRVHQIVPVDAEGKEGPILLPEGRVEEEVLKSQSGWVDVHKDTLVGDAVTQLQASPTFLPLFSIALPTAPSPPPSPRSTSQDLSPKSSSALPPPKHYFTELKPLFPPPPFTPSHPVFVHLSSLATTRSQELRAAAEDQIAQAIRDKAAELQQVEADLKLQVERLWKRFREGLIHIQQERNQIPHRSPAVHINGRELTTAVGSPAHDSPVAIRDFIPAGTPPRRTQSPPVPRMSSLSASLVTSSIRRPRAWPDNSGEVLTRPPSTPSPVSDTSESSHTLSSHSASSKTLTMQPSQVDGSSVLQFRRNTNDAINAAASYRWFMDLEAEIAVRKRELKEGDKGTDIAPESEDTNSTTSTNGINKPRRSRSNSQADGKGIGIEKDSKEGEPHGEQSGTSRKRKERKVTFDVQPAVVTIKRDLNSENEEEESALVDQNPGELMFDLEDEGSERTMSKTKPILPLIEQPAAIRPNRPRSIRPNLSDYMQNFSSLRPTSLPAPSHTRPPKSHQGVDASSSQAALLSPPPRVTSKDESRRLSKSKSSPPPPNEEEPLDPREAEILKLVAADIPSHRGAWRRDGKAWRSFVRRRSTDDSEEELDEGPTPDDDDLALGGEMVHIARARIHSEDDAQAPSRRENIVGSMPITIRALVPPRRVLSLASYQPQAAVGDRSSPPENDNTRSSSAAALRRASYAERDRARSIDPGALDFAAEGDETEEELEDGETDMAEEKLYVMSRGRKRALKILKAASKLPEPGMWRSLA